MFGEGLRTAAGPGRASGLRAAVGKPPKDERAGVTSRYGDLAGGSSAQRRCGLSRLANPWLDEVSRRSTGAAIEVRRRCWRADAAIPGSLRTAPDTVRASLSDGRSGVASALCWIWPCRVTAPSSGAPSVRGRSPGTCDASEALDHEHASAAAGAWGAALCRRGRLGGLGRCGDGEQFAGAGDVRLAPSRGEQAVVADAVEAPRQDVHQEAADNLSADSVMVRWWASPSRR